MPSPNVLFEPSGSVETATLVRLSGTAEIVRRIETVVERRSRC
jgi:hypothetical protein